MRFPPRILPIALSFLVLAGCRPFWLNQIDPPGTPEYKLGWEDGCDTGISAEGGWEYKMTYGYKKRMEFATNDQYKQGWNEGFSYCRFSFAATKDDGVWSDNMGWGQSNVWGNE